jgi:hypothetical protein
MKCNTLRIRTILLIIGYIVFSFGAAKNNGFYGNTQTRYFSFLNVGYDARTVSMAGASVAMPNDIYGVLSNPAAIGYLIRMQTLISYNPYFLDVKGGSLSFARPQGEFGVWAVNMVYLSQGSISGVDEYNNPTHETYNPYSLAGNVSWARRILESFSAGITVRGIYDQLSGVNNSYGKSSADGFACDIGAQYRLRSSRLIYGILVRNLGFVRSGYSDEDVTNKMPLSFSTGLSFVLRNIPAARIAFDLEKELDDFLEYKIGLELNFYKQMLFLRAGYTFSHSDLKEVISLFQSGSINKEYQKTNWSLFAAGFGVKTKVREIDAMIDCALNFRVDRLNPNFILSVILGF